MANCPICSGASTTHYAQARDIEYHTSDKTFDFYRCAACDVLFISPMLADRLSDIYPANYYSFADDRPRSMAVKVKEWLDRRRFRTLLSSIEGTELSALDVGGGTGWLLDMIRRTDARITSTSVVDIDAKAGAKAKRAGHDYFHGRFEDYDRDTKFDLVLMLNLIEHVADPVAVLSKARSLLKPGGIVLIKTPNFDALDARLFRHRSWAGFHTPRHFVLFRRSSLERLCTQSGFVIDQFTYTQGAPFWSISILEELRRLGWVDVTAARPAIYHPLVPLLQIAAAAFDYARKPFSTLSQMEVVLKKAG
jgi:2-polyprenyl-3-methyl-5-hydroxy-6-metoxy-1,4-benzoquinol methylase